MTAVYATTSTNLGNIILDEIKQVTDISILYGASFQKLKNQP